MGSTMTQNGKVQIICTLPDRNQPKRGYNQATAVLRSAVPVNHLADYHQNRHEKSISKLMDCRTVDKFDYVKGRPDSPKPSKKILRPLKRNEVQAWLQAGARIRVNPWKYTREIVYQNRILGSCTQADIASLVKDGIAERYPMPHGFYAYRCKQI